MARFIQRSRARRWLVGYAVLALVAAATTVPVASVGAVVVDPPDMVLDWNANAVAALSNPPTADPPGAGYTPPVATSVLAMVQGAVYSAVNAIDGGHQPYLHGLPAASPTASKAAAAAAAAYYTLETLDHPLPDNVRASLLGLYTASIGTITANTDRANGIAIGVAAATKMHNDRLGDHRWVADPFVAGTHVGQWRPELPAFVSDPFSWVSNVTPFTLNDQGQFRTGGPNPLSSAAYAVEFNEVKLMGRKTDSGRTDAQTNLALFFSANPFPMMNETLRTVAKASGQSIVEDARLFGMSSTASADALINCWVEKRHWSNWRPITAIREAAGDGNGATSPLPGGAEWLPLLNTPPYPDQSSGYNCFSAAMMHTATNFFGSIPIPFVLNVRSVLPAGTITASRPYNRFNAVLKDTIDARVWLGIHFRKADVDGAWIGKKVAFWVSQHDFQAIR